MDKFKYLNSYLTGKAAVVVAHLDLSEGNYEVGLSLLKESFGRKEVIIEGHMADCSISRQCVTSGTSANFKALLTK